IRAFQAWDYVQGSHDIIIAITDSGVKWNHPDLRGNIWINPAEAHNMSIDWDNGLILGGDGLNNNGGTYGKVDDLIGWDFFSNDNNPMQNWTNNDHGTHVAGCAAAVGNNGIGIAGPSPIASIMSCKGSSNTSNSTGISYGYNMMQYAAEMGAHIINASWGGPGNGSYANNIVNYCTNMGSLVVAAAGNSNIEHGVGGYNDYPADCTNAMNVAATNAGDYKTSFSDFGAPIDICAPGEAVLSTIILNNGYAAYDGTSMASPVVAGVAALVKSMHPGLPPLDLKERLMMTADYIYDKNPSYVGKLGSGRVNAFAATMYDKIPYIVIDDMSLEEITGDGDGVANPGEEIRMKLQLNNYLDPFTGLAWANATNVQTTIRCHYPGVTIIDSTATYGSLFAGSSMWNNSQPFRFRTVSGLPSEPIPFELVVSSNQTDSYPYNKVIPFNVVLSLEQYGWPMNLGGASQTSPIIYDIDGNGQSEIIFGDHTGHVNVMRINGSQQLAGFPLNLGASVVGSIAMANLTGDTNNEFVACLSNNNIVAFNRFGEILWNVPAGGTLRSGPVIATLSLSGHPQILVTTQNRFLVVLDHEGNYYPNFPIQLDGAMLSPPAVADLNLDGNLEIVCVTIGGSLHAISRTTAQNISGFPVTLPGGSQNPVTIANLDADANPEILVGTSSSGHLLAYNHDGTIKFQKNVSGQVRTAAVVADVNNNGSKEVILITYDGTVYITNSEGADLPGFPVSIGINTECSPVVARFDGDNHAGIIFGDTGGMLHSIRPDGNQSANFPIHLGGNLKISAALRDADADGDMEIVIPNDSGFHVIDVKRPAQSLLWHCYLG
ncbi:MAG: S8 family serine peptidase, partial [Candidatus Cloacimonadaceae bacterium]|nr:S8 family serine peptidase [Candidatus Cloacimonadaceae bacterium]